MGKTSCGETPVRLQAYRPINEAKRPKKKLRVLSEEEFSCPLRILWLPAPGGFSPIPFWWTGRAGAVNRGAKIFLGCNRFCRFIDDRYSVIKHWDEHE